jgi:subtilase family serine protease
LLKIKIKKNLYISNKNDNINAKLFIVAINKLKKQQYYYFNSTLIEKIKNKKTIEVVEGKLNRQKNFLRW